MAELSGSEAPFDLERALAGLCRGDLSQFDSCLVLHAPASMIEGTKAHFRCHFIRSDGNGLPRIAALAQQMAVEALFHCIPRRALENLKALSDDDRLRESVKLSRDAAKLFTQTQPNTGEGGELLLYAMLEQSLGVPQILSKMSLKTNPNVQIHGTDGVHAKVLPNGNLALYWGEAKVYDTLSNGLSDCFSSIAPYLLGKSTQQDTFLLRHYADLGDDNLRAKLLEYFDDSNPKSANVEVRGACLVGFSHSNYPNLPADLQEVQGELDAAAASWQKSTRTRIENQKIEAFEIEVFFLPLPSASDFRDAVKRAFG